MVTECPVEVGVTLDVVGSEEVVDHKPFEDEVLSKNVMVSKSLSISRLSMPYEKKELEMFS